MEAFDPRCFALLTSFLYLNELPQLRLVCRSFRDRLAEPRTVALLARQPRALVFPAQWEADACRFSGVRGTTKERRGFAPSSGDSFDQPAECGFLRVVPYTEEEPSCTPRRGAGSSAPRSSWSNECVCDRSDHPTKRRRANFSILKSLLAVPPSGIRQLSLYWPEDLSRPLCETFVRILIVTAPRLEHLMSFGSSLAVWRCTWPLTVSFPSLKRLDVANNCGATTAKRYQECLKWHLLARCSFPACLEFRWMDSFEWGDEDRHTLWHEVVAHQLDCFLGLLSSMTKLRRLAFTADSQYTVAQVLQYLGSLPNCTVQTLEIIPGLPNCESLDRDWLLPRRPSSAFPDEEIVAIPSITSVCFVLRECDLDYFLQTEVFGLLKRVCPDAVISVDGTLLLDICRHGCHLEGLNSFQIPSPRDSAKLCRDGRSRSLAYEFIRAIVMQPGVTELSLKAEGERGQRAISLRLSTRKCQADGWDELGVRVLGTYAPYIPPRLSVDVSPAAFGRWPCLPEHLDDLARSVPGVLLRLNDNRKDLELSLGRPSIAQKVVGFEVCLRNGALISDVEELLTAAFRCSGPKARFLRIVDVWSPRVQAAWPSSDGVLESFLDFMVHSCCPSIQVIEYRIVSPASWRRESGSDCSLPSSLADVLTDFSFQQRLDCLFDRGTDETQARRTSGHLTVFIYHRRTR